MDLSHANWNEIIQGNPDWWYFQDIEQKEIDAVKQNKQPPTQIL